MLIRPGSFSALRIYSILRSCPTACEFEKICSGGRLRIRWSELSDILRIRKNVKFSVYFMRRNIYEEEGARHTHTFLRQKFRKNVKLLCFGP